MSHRSERSTGERVLVLGMDEAAGSTDLVVASIALDLRGHEIEFDLERRRLIAVFAGHRHEVPFDEIDCVGRNSEGIVVGRLNTVRIESDRDEADRRVLAALRRAEAQRTAGEIAERRHSLDELRRHRPTRGVDESA